MPSEDDIGLDEKRMYGETRDETEAFVASGMGVTRVELAGDQIGRFSLAHRTTATSIAGGDGQLVVGTESDVLIGTDDEFLQTEFGPARTVSLADGSPVAVSPDGRVARLAGDDWETVGHVTGPRRMDGDLLATRDGIYRVGDGLVSLGGGNAVRDVAVGGSAGPYAATADGLLRYDDGWHREAGGDCLLVAADGERAHALSEDGLLVRRGDDWQVHDRPNTATFADITHGESLYAVTADGVVFVYAAPDHTPDGQGGWRSRELGMPKVTGIAVP